MQSNERLHFEPEANRRQEGGRPPRRLQNRAPEALQLDSIPHGSATKNPFAADSGAAIPLLSPLILCPVQLQELEDKGGAGVEDSGEGGNNQGKVVALPPGGGEGWQHPAVASTDTSSLFRFFQSQCVLVDQQK